MKSKKTKAVTKKRKAKRDNAAILFGDPIFMHHMLACVYRSLELTLSGFFRERKIDAEFLENLITPEGTGAGEGGQE